MRTRLMVVFASLSFALSALFVSTATPAAATTVCPDVEVIFARGTAEPLPPIGITGNAFSAAVRSELPGKSVETYGVNYQASAGFNDPIAFAGTFLGGVRDAQARVSYIAATCPATKIVLGGYSQGAELMEFVATDGNAVLRPKYAQYADYIPGKMDPAAADHVAALVLFAPPSQQFLSDAGAPTITPTAELQARTLAFCIPGDTVCNGAPLQPPNALHTLYSVDGDTARGAQYAAAHV